MSRVLLIGGHGRVALLAIPLLAGDGHAVDAVIRNPEHAAEVQAAGATAVVADVETMDTDALAELIDGHEVVVWSAGAGGGAPARTVAVDRDAAIRSVDAAARTGVGHYVMVSYFGAGRDGVPADNPFHTYAQAKADADAHLRSASLPWTILAPSTLTFDEGTGRIGLDDTAGQVARADVAAVLAAVVSRGGPTRATIAFNQGSTPIAAALDQVAPGTAPA